MRRASLSRIRSFLLGAHTLTLLCLVIPVLVSACQPGVVEVVGPNADEPWRGIHVIGYDNDADLEELAAQLPELSTMGVNVLMLEVDYHFEYQSHPELRQDSTQITLAGARAFAETCRALDIRLIPQFQCLGHQSWAETTYPLLVQYPELDITPGAFPNNEGIYCREWDPTNPAVNEIAFALMGELIDAFEADAIHVGMDEVFLLAHEQSPTTAGLDPADLFATAVNDYYDFLVREKGVEMLMWGDRLIDATEIDYGDWEASSNGTARAIDRIPKDIILCDWHYESREAYPSVPMFLENGFRVIPSGWREAEATRAFINYSLQYDDNPRMLGHLFTTWMRIDTLATWPPIVQGLDLLK